MAIPRLSRLSSSSGCSRRCAGPAFQKHTCSVLHQTITEGQIFFVFSQYGKVSEVRLLRDPEGSPKGSALVSITSRPGAEAVVRALHGKKQIEVRECSNVLAG